MRRCTPFEHATHEGKNNEKSSMTTTTQVFIRSFRGYWVGPDKDAGYGLKLPSDLQPIEPHVSIHSRKWNIWL